MDGYKHVSLYDYLETQLTACDLSLIENFLEVRDVDYLLDLVIHEPHQKELHGYRCDTVLSSVGDILDLLHSDDYLTVNDMDWIDSFLEEREISHILSIHI